MESKIVHSFEACKDSDVRHCNKLCSTVFCFATVSKSYQTWRGKCLHLETRGSPRLQISDCPGGRRLRFQPGWSWSAFWSPSLRLRWWRALQQRSRKPPTSTKHESQRVMFGNGKRNPEGTVWPSSSSSSSSSSLDSLMCTVMERLVTGLQSKYMPKPMS